MTMIFVRQRLSIHSTQTEVCATRLECAFDLQCFACVFQLKESRAFVWVFVQGVQHEH
jgi:hypothetical protein